jgi:chaperonin cofactor prefoldin
MAAALEERCSREVVSRNEAIEALKRENETLEAEKARLSEDLKDLPSTWKEVEALKKERDELKVGSEFLKREKEEAEASTAILRESVSEVERARDLAV